MDLVALTWHPGRPVAEKRAQAVSMASPSMVAVPWALT
jgi:hypothetical protein